MSKKYGVILADPPWQYENYAAAPGETHDRARGAQKHYPTMTLDDLARLPIPAKENAVLFMWATWPLIQDAFLLIDAWGFISKTLAWEWVKFNQNGFSIFTGMGYYTRSNPEPCLLAFNGNPVPVSDRSVSAVLMSPIRKHSQKPQEQYERIYRLYPDSGPYLELFARRPRAGWDVWGNEVDSDISLLGVEN